MKRIINLVKVLFRLNVNSSTAKKKKNNILLYVILGIYLLFVFFNLWKSFIDPLKDLGQETQTVYLVLTVSSSLILITSITYIANILYFTNDMENIIPFPFRPREIFASKLIVAYLYELLIASMLSLPGFLMVGITLHEGPLFYLFGFIVFLCIPIVPIAALTILYTILVQFFAVKKHKNAFQIVTTILVLVVIVLFQMQLNQNMTSNGTYSGEYLFEMSQNMKNNMPYYLKVGSHIFENVGSMTSILSFLWFLVLHIGAIALTVFGFDRLFMKGVFQHKEGASTIVGKEKRNYQKNTAFLSMIVNEIKKLFRNVTYFIQCVLPVVIVPAIIIVSLFSNPQVEMALDSGTNPVIKNLFAFLMIQFFMMMNQISATAISRDGKQEATFYLSLPVTKQKLFAAKAVPSMIVGILSLCAAMIFNKIFFQLSGIEILLLVIGGLLLNSIQSYLFLLIDLHHPKLQWESEMAVVKHNLNVLKAIGLWFLVIILTSLIGNLFLILHNNYFSVGYVMILLLAWIMLQEFVKHHVEQWYAKII